MQVRDNKPEPETAVPAATELAALDGADLDDDTAAAINRAEEQIDRGEGIDFHRFAAEMRRNIAAG